MDVDAVVHLQSTKEDSDNLTNYLANNNTIYNTNNNNHSNNNSSNSESIKNTCSSEEKDDYKVVADHVISSHNISLLRMSTLLRKKITTII